MNLKDAMTIQTPSILLAILIITTFSLGIFVFAQAPTGEIVNDSSNVQVSNNSVTPNLKNLMANAAGHISSAQNDGNNTWITWGKWALVSNTSGLQNDSNPLRFNATISSVKSDNTERHNHKIHDFKLTELSVTNSSESTILMLDGTATISTNDEQSVLLVPVSIKIIETGQATAWNNTEPKSINPSWSPKGGTISVLIGDKMFHGHFGDTPVYGIVNKPEVP